MGFVLLEGSGRITYLAVINKVVQQSHKLGLVQVRRTRGKAVDGFERWLPHRRLRSSWSVQELPKCLAGQRNAYEVHWMQAGEYLPCSRESVIDLLAPKTPKIRCTMVKSSSGSRERRSSALMQTSTSTATAGRSPACRRERREGSGLGALFGGMLRPKFKRQKWTRRVYINRELCVPKTDKKR